MARINGAVRSETADSLERERRRERELVALFGRDLVKRASGADPADLDLSAELMDAVHDAADRMLDRVGDPQAQRALIKTLPGDVRLVLCMWIQDLNMAVRMTTAVLWRAA